jgi:histidinol-phosphatase (PHP family)
LDEAHRLKHLYAPQIDLLVGLETDYITPLDIDALERLLEREQGRIEYVVGSVHHVNEQGIDFSKEWWEACLSSFESSSSPSDTASNGKFTDAATTSYLLSYLTSQHTLLTRLQPPVIGHFDLCRLYTPALPLTDAQRFPGVWEAVRRNVQEVVAYGGMFEVSAASFRKGWGDGYPGREVLQVCLFLPFHLSHSVDFCALRVWLSVSSPMAAAYASRTTRTARML